MIGSQLVVFEGISGAGKSANIELLQNNSDNIDSVKLQIAQLFHCVEKSNYINYDNTDYYLLFDYLKTILFRDSTKKVVLFERYYLSTLAHTYAIGCKTGDFSLHEVVFNWYKKNIGQGLRKPDVYLYLNIPVEDAISRINARNQISISSLWLEREYMEMCEDYKLQFIQEQESDVKLIHIDALQKIEVVQEEIKRYLCELDPQQKK